LYRRIAVFAINVLIDRETINCAIHQVRVKSVKDRTEKVTTGRMDHSGFFKPLLETYFKLPPAQKPNVLKVIIAYGNFPALVNCLSGSWFGLSHVLYDSSSCLEFFISYVLESPQSLAQCSGPDLAAFYTGLLELSPQPSSFATYNAFLAILIPFLKDTEGFTDLLCRCPYECALFPLTFYGTIVPEFNIQAWQLLTQKLPSALKSSTARTVWLESFILFICRSPNSSIAPQDIIGLIDRH
jgi:hypothetical protein